MTGIPTAAESKLAQIVLRNLGLRAVDPEFKFFDTESHWTLTFEWDGAGVDSNENLSLVEVEDGPINDWHIQTHLSRLAIMQGRGEHIARLVWVVPNHSLSTLRDTVDSWIAFFSPILKIAFPKMQYYSPDGVESS